MTSRVATVTGQSPGRVGCDLTLARGGSDRGFEIDRFGLAWGRLWVPSPFVWRLGAAIRTP